MKFIGRPRIFNTVDELIDGMKNYFEYCENENKRSLKEIGKPTKAPNVESLCDYIGIAKDTFYAYKKRKDINGESFGESIQLALQHIVSEKLNGMLLGFIRELSGIFDMKNNHGYVDKTTVVSENVEIVTDDDIDSVLKNRKKIEGGNNKGEETE
jgi:hypothetical protein